MIQAVIFNLDGVLVCTDECHYHAWTKLAYEQGIHLQPDLYLKMKRHFLLLSWRLKRR